MFDPHGILRATTKAQHAAGARAMKGGSAVRLAPGVYATPEAAATVLGRAHAALAWCPDAVITGRAAARLTFWPGCPVTSLDVAHPTRSRGPTWIQLHRRHVDPSWIHEHDGLRLTHPALTAAILAGGEGGGDAVDQALRAGVRLSDIRDAPAQGWPGAAGRRQVLADSRDEPWSAAERRAHALLRQGHITGWRANVAIRIGAEVFRGDIVFSRERLILEIDGFEHHSSRASFEADRRRQNLLVLAGWRVLRFTWASLEDADGFRRTVRAALAM